MLRAYASEIRASEVQDRTLAESHRLEAERLQQAFTQHQSTCRLCQSSN